VQPCLRMTVHWLNLVGKPMTSCHRLAKQSQARINVKGICRFTRNSANAWRRYSVAVDVFGRRDPSPRHRCAG
jgi:hypothetical protein